MFKLRGFFNGQAATLLLDSGASGEFIDPAFAARCGLTLSPSDRTIKLADGTVVPALGRVSTECALAAKTGAPVSFTSTFTATPLEGYDAILGVPWLAAHDPLIGWKNRSISVRNAKGVPRLIKPLECIEDQPQPKGLATLSLNSLRKAHRRGEIDELFVVMAKPTADANGAPPREDPAAEALLAEFADVFPDKLPPGLPPKRGVEHAIELKPGARPPPVRPLRHQSSKDLAVFEEYTRELIAAGQLRVSNSPYGAMALIVRKKDGTPRVVVDYRGLNEITVKNKYPLPLMDEMFDRVHGARYFTKIDLRSGFHQIGMAEADIEKTAFRTRYGSFEYLVLPMGLCNAPGTFMQLMNSTFRDLLDKSVLVFLDDILVFSRTKEEHIKHVREVLVRLRAQKLYAKRSKCEFFRSEVEFLGHRIGANGLSVSQDKVQAVRDWPTPKNVHDVRSFLGLAGFYRRFVKDFSKIALPITELTKEKTTPFVWGQRQQQAFDALKAALCSAPVLLTPDPSKPYTLNCDACDYAVGATLQQDHGNGLQPVAYMSRKLKPAEINYDTREKEFMALVDACSHWRHYLHSDQPFTLLSDHDSLKYHKTMPHLSGRLARWVEKMAEFDYNIEHIAGSKNVVADALSRRADLRPTAKAPDAMDCADDRDVDARLAAVDSAWQPVMRAGRQHSAAAAARATLGRSSTPSSSPEEQSARAQRNMGADCRRNGCGGDEPKGRVQCDARGCDCCPRRPYESARCRCWAPAPKPGATGQTLCHQCHARLAPRTRAVAGAVGADAATIVAKLAATPSPSPPQERSWAQRVAAAELSPEAVAAQRERNRAAAEQSHPPAPDRPAPNAKGAIVMPSQRCTAQTAKGEHCKQRTAKGQYCWNHLRSISGLRIMKSKAIPTGGMGLFAARRLPADTRIDYTGDRVPLQSEDDGGAYFLQIARGQAIDAARTNAGEGRWVNDPRGSDKAANAEFSLYTPPGKPRVACVRTLRPIERGEEILVKYGAEYWRYQAPKSKRRPKKAAAAAGRRAHGAMQIAQVTEAQVSSSLTDDIRRAALADADYAALVARPPPNHDSVGGLLWHDERLCVPNDKPLRTRILAECHDAVTGAHFGRDKMLAAVKARFEWQGLSADVERYVTTCDSCQRNKPSQQATPGLLMPLPIPERPLLAWTQDMLSGLSTTRRGHDAIQVYVERLIKLKHFSAVRTTDGAAELAADFVRTVVRAHGVPESIVSDRDPRFTAHFYAELTKLMGITLHMSTARHPQSDGQSEREIRTLVTALRAFCNEHQDDWDDYLDMLELGFNSAVQASTQRSPFELLYGVKPRLPIDVALAPIAPKVPAAIDRAERMQAALRFVREQLLTAQQRQARNADRHRRPAAFAVGDSVLLSTEGLQLRNFSNKLCSRFIGPFRVTAVVNANAYTLALPPQLQALHPTFNIEKLKAYRDGRAAFPDRPLPFDRPPPDAQADSNGDEVWLVERILAQRKRGRADEFLVQWKGYPPEENTWEPRSSLRGAPDALAEFLHNQRQASED